MDIKERVKILLKLRKYELREKATKLKLENVDDVGRVKLAVMVAIKENMMKIL